MAKKNSLITPDELFSELDPIQAALMILGGTASVCGITPPMTQLLKAFGGDLSQASGILQEQGIAYGGAGAGPIKWILDWYTSWSIFNPSAPQVSGTAADRQAQLLQLGLFCSGAVEAAIMYEFVKNKETFNQLIKLPGEVAQGLGKLIP
jgi:hypothetical protein